jgi:hypothetical protein
VFSIGTSVCTSQTVRRHKPEDGNLRASTVSRDTFCNAESFDGSSKALMAYS